MEAKRMLCFFLRRMRTGLVIAGESRGWQSWLGLDVVRHNLLTDRP